jgi:dipeptidyl aminopeptidase/acylaminoacyl peptidase
MSATSLSPLNLGSGPAHHRGLRAKPWLRFFMVLAFALSLVPASGLRAQGVSDGARGPMGATLPVAGSAGDALDYDLAFDKREFLWDAVPAVSPDGRRVAYVVRHPPQDVDLNSRFMSNGTPSSVVGARVFVTHRLSGETEDLCPGGNCWRPTWSPDGGRLAFYSDRDGPPQLWIHEIATGEARRVSPARIKAKLWAGDEPLWSPDGSTLYVPLAPESGPGSWLPASPEATARVPADGEATVSVLKSGKEVLETMDPPSPPLTEHYLRENNADLAAIEVHTGEVAVLAQAEGEPRPSVLRVSPSGRWLSYLSVFKEAPVIGGAGTVDLAVVPSAGGPVWLVAADLPGDLPDYHGLNYSWHPTRDQLVYLKGGELWLADVGARGPGGSRRLGADLGVLAPTINWFTPDGRAAVVGMDPVEDDVGTRPFTLAIVPLDGGPATRIPIPGGWVYGSILKADERTIWQPEAGSVTLVLTETGTGESAIVRFDYLSGGSRVLWKGLGRIADLTGAGSHDFMMGTYEDLTTPPNVYRFSADFGERDRISNIDPRLDEVGRGTAEVFETMVPLHDGQLSTLRTVVLLPAGARRGDRLPGIVMVYPGGDQTRNALRFGGGSDLTVPNLLFTSRGYAVILTNLRLGPEREGGNPAQEIMDVLMPQVYRAAELGYVDLSRLAVGGQSYGGYGTVAVVGATNLFRAAIPVNGIYDLPGTYGHLSPGGGSPFVGWAEGGQGRMGTHPWANLRRYIDNSPYYRADRIFTPVLIVHGAEDSAYHDGQKLFSALRRLDRPAQLLSYAGEGHVIYYWSRANAVDVSRRMVEFLTRHLGDPGAAAPPPAGG